MTANSGTAGREQRNNGTMKWQDTEENEPRLGYTKESSNRQHTTWESGEVLSHSTPLSPTLRLGTTSD